MTTSFSGQLTIGACIPLVATAQAQIDTAASISLGEVEAKVAGALEGQARLAVTPPSLAANLAFALQMVQDLQAAIAIGTPDAVFDASGAARIAAELQATLGQLQASIAFAASLGVTLGTPGIYLFRTSGAVGTRGTELQAEIGGGLPTGGGPNVQVEGFILLAASNAAKAALGATFG